MNKYGPLSLLAVKLFVLLCESSLVSPLISFSNQLPALEELEPLLMFYGLTTHQANSQSVRNERWCLLNCRFSLVFFHLPPLSDPGWHHPPAYKRSNSNDRLNDQWVFACESTSRCHGDCGCVEGCVFVCGPLKWVNISEQWPTSRVDSSST